MRKITENTLIPISLFIVFCGVVWWASSITKEVQANSIEIGEIKACSRDVQEKFNKIAIDIEVIKNEIKKNGGNK